MNIASTSAAATTSGSTTPQSTRKTSLTQEDFLGLMLTQMRYQNPLNPMDNYQMAAQMAQLGTIEGINKMTESMQLMSAYQASMANLQVTGLIGKKVEAIGNSMMLKDGSAAEGSYQLARPGRVTIEIYNGEGKLVRTINEGLKETTKQKFTWDGKNQAGEKVPDGAYTFSVKAVDTKGDSIPASTSIIGVVEGISFENGITYVNIGSARITLANICAILA